MKNYTISFLTALLSFTSLLAQLQSPDEFLGYTLGERFTPHHRVVDYFEHVASNHEQVDLINYGSTYEGRPLYLAIVTSPENYKRLESIRLEQLKAAGLENGESQQDVAIVWLSYNVHGNESVSTEVSMKTLHTLADPTNETSKEWLKNTVVIIDPCINPDGRERYVNWYRQKGNSPYNNDPNSLEHREPWPGGRANHYLFDLNRDWAWATQIETQQRLEWYQKWMPHVHVDFHEQGVNSPYYFAPAAEPYHEAVTDFQREFQRTIGKNHAKYFDKEGWLYFTREVFDLLYPSYGDTYPTFNGAIGMTYEQGGSGRAGLGVLNKEGNELTLKDRIAHHYTTGLSTVEVSSLHAERLINEYATFFKESIEAPSGPYRSYIVKGGDKDRIRSLRTLLDRHQIKYGTVEESRRAEGYSYFDEKEQRFNIEPNDLVINSNQSKSTFIKTLFEPTTKLSDSLTYDITAWSLPYARGLQAYATKNTISTVEYRDLLDMTNPFAVDKPYAYLSKWTHVEDAEFLAALLENKVKARFAEQKFRLEGVDYPAGTLIITRAGNEKLSDFDDRVKRIAAETNRRITAVKTGLVDYGSDLGSGKVRYIDPPKIALLGGSSVSSLNFGAIWHFFEQQLHYPVTVLDTRYFSGVDLSKYDVLVLPSGWYSGVLNKKGLQKLKDWVSHGGRLVAVGSAVRTFATSDDFELSIHDSKKSEEAAKRRQDSIQMAERLVKYEDKERTEISNYITGSIFKVKMDNSSPLGFGYSDRYFSLKVSHSHYAYLKNGLNVGVILKEADKVSGFVGKNAQKNTGASLVYGVESMGKGELVYLIDDPLYRSFWENGKLLFCNALFMVGN